MYEVIKEFAGVKVGTKREFHKRDASYLEENGYIKPLKPAVKSRKKENRARIGKTKNEIKKWT